MVSRKKEIGNGEHHDMALAQRFRPVSDSLLPISHSPERMRIAVILTTYNRPDALALVLESYLAQDTRAFELIVADDGSTDDTRRVVEDYGRRTQSELRHVWQEDLGFRPAAIRNRALAATSADYVIFSDGDCLAPRNFVAQHARLSEPGYFLSGNRVLLSGAFTAQALEQRLPLHAWRTRDWVRAWLRNDVNRCLPLLRLPDGAFRKRKPAQWEGVKTCNLSAWRADLMRVNGLDESYTGWGLEDSDLVIRLLRTGVKHKSARFAAPVFHLWHRDFDRSRLADNQRRLDEILASRRTEALVGVDQYL
jgi:glycosyltransferase involved in cell wall biosynthesis